MIQIVAHGILGTSYRQVVVVGDGLQESEDLQVLHDIGNLLSKQYGDNTPMTGWSIQPAPSGMWLNRLERAFDINYSPAYVIVSFLIPRGKTLRQEAIQRIERSLLLNHSKYMQQSVIQYGADWSFLQKLGNVLDGMLDNYSNAVEIAYDASSNIIAYWTGDIRSMLLNIWDGLFFQYKIVFTGNRILAQGKDFVKIEASLSAGSKAASSYADIPTSSTVEDIMEKSISVEDIDYPEDVERIATNKTNDEAERRHYEELKRIQEEKERLRLEEEARAKKIKEQQEEQLKKEEESRRNKELLNQEREKLHKAKLRQEELLKEQEVLRRELELETEKRREEEARLEEEWKALREEETLQKKRIIEAEEKLKSQEQKAVKQREIEELLRHKEEELANRKAKQQELDRKTRELNEDRERLSKEQEARERVFIERQKQIEKSQKQLALEYEQLTKQKEEAEKHLKEKREKAEAQKKSEALLKAQEEELNVMRQRTREMQENEAVIKKELELARKEQEERERKQQKERERLEQEKQDLLAEEKRQQELAKKEEKERKELELKAQRQREEEERIEKERQELLAKKQKLQKEAEERERLKKEAEENLKKEKKREEQRRKEQKQRQKEQERRQKEIELQKAEEENIRRIAQQLMEKVQRNAEKEILQQEKQQRILAEKEQKKADKAKKKNEIRIKKDASKSTTAGQNEQSENVFLKYSAIAVSIVAVILIGVLFFTSKNDRVWKHTVKSHDFNSYVQYLKENGTNLAQTNPARLKEAQDSLISLAGNDMVCLGELSNLYKGERIGDAAISKLCSIHLSNMNDALHNFEMSTHNYGTIIEKYNSSVNFFDNTCGIGVRIRDEVKKNNTTMDSLVIFKSESEMMAYKQGVNSKYEDDKAIANSAKKNLMDLIEYCRLDEEKKNEIRYFVENKGNQRPKTPTTKKKEFNNI